MSSNLNDLKAFKNKIDQLLTEMDKPVETKAIKCEQEKKCSTTLVDIQPPLTKVSSNLIPFNHVCKPFIYFCIRSLTQILRLHFKNLV